MKPVDGEPEDEAIAIMRAVRDANGRTGTFDEAQARLDLRATVELSITRILENGGQPGGRGHKSPERILAETLASTYFTHTGNGPGRAIHNSGKEGGRYPAFIRSLAGGAGIEVDTRALQSACREAQRQLSKDAGLPVKPKAKGLEADLRSREEARAELLKPHVVSNDEQGDPIFGGYEPAREKRPASETFEGAIKYYGSH